MALKLLSATHFASPAHNQFAYRLTGLRDHIMASNPQSTDAKAAWNGHIVINGATSDHEVAAIEKRLRQQFPGKQLDVVRNPAGMRW
jgi:hypothetical protein